MQEPLEPVIDMLANTRRNVTKEQFNQWKRHPITEMFFLDIQMGMLARLSESLGHDGLSMQRALEREGAKQIVETIWNWEPSSMVQEGEDEAA